MESYHHYRITLISSLEHASGAQIPRQIREQPQSSALLPTKAASSPPDLILLQLTTRDCYYNGLSGVKFDLHPDLNAARVLHGLPLTFAERSWFTSTAYRWFLSYMNQQKPRASWFVLMMNTLEALLGFIWRITSYYLSIFTAVWSWKHNTEGIQSATWSQWPLLGRVSGNIQYLNAPGVFVNSSTPHWASDASPSHLNTRLYEWSCKRYNQPRMPGCLWLSRAFWNLWSAIDRSHPTKRT